MNPLFSFVNGNFKPLTNECNRVHLHVNEIAFHQEEYMVNRSCIIICLHKILLIHQVGEVTWDHKGKNLSNRMNYNLLKLSNVCNENGYKSCGFSAFNVIVLSPWEDQMCFEHV